MLIFFRMFGCYDWTKVIVTVAFAFAVAVNVVVLQCCCWCRCCYLCFILSFAMAHVKVWKVLENDNKSSTAKLMTYHSSNLQPKMTHSSVGQKAIFVAQKLLHFVIFVFVVQAEKWSERFNKKNKVPAIFSASKTENNLVRTYQILDLPQVLHCCKTQNLRGGHYNIGKDFLRLWPLPKSSASSLVYLGGR